MTQGYVAIVDASDYDLVAAFKWYPLKGMHTVYARRCDGAMMHRLILGLRPDERGDHINGDGLDNRRANLRPCTQRQNSFNARSFRGKYKGVKWEPRHRKWRARILVERRDIYLGLYKNVDDAARAYNDAARQLFGEFARLNDVPSSPTCPSM